MRFHFGGHGIRPIGDSGPAQSLQADLRTARCGPASKPTPRGVCGCLVFSCSLGLDQGGGETRAKRAGVSVRSLHWLRCVSTRETPLLESTCWEPAAPRPHSGPWCESSRQGLAAPLGRQELQEARLTSLGSPRPRWLLVNKGSPVRRSQATPTNLRH